MLPYARRLSPYRRLRGRRARMRILRSRRTVRAGHRIGLPESDRADRSPPVTRQTDVTVCRRRRHSNGGTSTRRQYVPSPCCRSPLLPSRRCRHHRGNRGIRRTRMQFDLQSATTRAHSPRLRDSSIVWHFRPLRRPPTAGRRWYTPPARHRRTNGPRRPRSCHPETGAVFRPKHQ